jgi:hypothetical protein
VIDKVRCYRRDGKIMPNHGDYRIIITALRRSPAIGSLIREIHAFAQQSGADVDALQASVLRTLEAMVAEGWVKATYDPDRARLNVKTPEETELFHKNVDTFREPAGAV